MRGLGEKLCSSGSKGNLNMCAGLLFKAEVTLCYGSDGIGGVQGKRKQLGWKESFIRQVSAMKNVQFQYPCN